MNAQFDLIHESIYDALRDAVRALGGSKKFGPVLFPAKGNGAAGWLDDCISQDRKAKLSIEEMIFLLRAAREAGYHGAMGFLGSECGYRMEPIEPHDEHAALMRDYIESVKVQQRITARLERLAAGPSLAKVA